jgi:hypothetical protein
VVCLGPRDPGEIVGPWPLSDVGARPLNFTVRRVMRGSLASVAVRLVTFALSFGCIGFIVLLLSMVFLFNVHGGVLPYKMLVPTLVVEAILVALASWLLARAAERALTRRP